MNNNVAHIKVTEGMDLTSNLMNMHVIFEDEKKKILGEVEDIDQKIIKVSFLGEIINGRFVDMGAYDDFPNNKSCFLSNDLVLTNIVIIHLYFFHIFVWIKTSIYIILYNFSKYFVSLVYTLYPNSSFLSLSTAVYNQMFFKLIHISSSFNTSIPFSTFTPS